MQENIFFPLPKKEAAIRRRRSCAESGVRPPFSSSKSGERPPFAWKASWGSWLSASPEVAPIDAAIRSRRSCAESGVGAGALAHGGDVAIASSVWQHASCVAGGTTG